MCDVTVNFRRRDDLWEDGGFDAKELEQGRVPLQLRQVHEQSTRRVRDVADVNAAVDASRETLNTEVR